MYIHVYTCIHICIYVCMYVYIYIYILDRSTPQVLVRHNDLEASVELLEDGARGQSVSLLLLDDHY